MKHQGKKIKTYLVMATIIIILVIIKCLRNCNKLKNKLIDQTFYHQKGQPRNVEAVELIYKILKQAQNLKIALW